jgi:hypothetical protein
MQAFGLAIVVSLAAGAACNAIPPTTSAPANTCSSSECSAYVQPGPQPSCTLVSTTRGLPPSGLCLVPGQATGLAIIVELPLTAGYAPGATFATLYDPFVAGAQAHPIAECPGCAALPAFVPVQGAYLINQFPTINQQLNFPLGNAMGYTALPAEATFRLLWPPSGGTSGVTAESLGLPIEPIQAVQFAPTNPRAPGPAGGLSQAFRAFLQPGSYEIVLRPSSPFDSVFGPEVSGVTLASSGSTVQLPPPCPAPATAQLQCVEGFDVTQETGQGPPTIPTFDISRTNGLVGWTAYIRDSSGTIVSNVAPLSGSAAHVVLATHHLPAQGPAGADALTGTALVIAPPAGAPYPTAVFAPIGNVLPATETYPALPAPAVIAGSILSVDDTSVAADVLFQALAITDANGVSNTSNFEFVGEAQAQPGGSYGLPAYSIELPQGTYRVSVRPLDQTLQVTTLTLVVGAQNDPSQGNVVVASPRSVSGTAHVADGRDLSGAGIDAEPVACSGGLVSPWCMPRESTAITAADGSFQLSLDPGQYWLRVRPADGTRLPWTLRPLSVGVSDSPTTLAPITVPAPVAAGLTLVDPTGAPIAQAQVRFFSLSSDNAAVEVGRALSDQYGTFEMYLQPPAQ